MGERLGESGSASHWLRAVLHLASGDFNEFATAVLDRPDVGSLDSLVSSAVEIAGAHEWARLPDVEVDACRAALRRVLARVAIDLKGSFRDRMLVEALEDAGAWERRFLDCQEASRARKEFGPGTDAERAFSTALRVLSGATARWVREQVDIRRLLVASAGETLRRLERMEQRQTSSTQVVVDSEVGGLHSAGTSSLKLTRRSQRLIGELGSTFSRGGDRGDATLYVEREIEPKLLDRLMNQRGEVVLVIGEAGFGKSSLLWGLASRIEGEPCSKAVLMSATWLADIAGSESGLTRSQVVEALAELSADGTHVVLLLDTADLLLHSEASALATEELMLEIASLGLSVVAAVRPTEAEVLGPQFARLDLLAYSPPEVDRATRALMAWYFPELSADAGVALVTTALARGLPVSEVLQSPLLLRMLFDLSGGVLPSMELDVTELYRRYWSLRIESDQRGRKIRDLTKEDLSDIAQRAAIAMLAEGRPEVETGTLLRIMERVEMSSAPIASARGLETLVARGVIVGHGGHRRFYHQTLFEFAAAVGLARRGGTDEARRLCDHMLEHPLDLFVGAVLEQLLVLLVTERSSRESTVELLMRLITSGHPTVARIGLMAWAHWPAAAIDVDHALLSLPAEAVQRFLAVVPQVADLATNDCARAVRAVWTTRRLDCGAAVVRTLGRLARRDGEGVALLLRDMGIAEYYSNEGRSVLTNPGELYDLVFALAPADRDLVRGATLQFLSGMASGEIRATLLRYVTEHWDVLRGGDFLDSVVATCSGMDLPRVTHIELGRLLERDRQLSEVGTRDNWVKLAAEAFAVVTPSAASLTESASIASVAVYLSSLGDADIEEIDEIITLALGTPAVSGPPRLVGLFLAPLLANESVARARLLPRLLVKLEQGLPVPDEMSHRTQEQNWALAIRIAFADPGTPTEVVASLADRFAADRDWLSDDRLLQLLPAAAAGGAERPAELVRALANEPDRLSPTQVRDFLDYAREVVERDRDVADAYVSLALALRQPGPLHAALLSAVGTDALRARSVDIERLIQALLGGADEQQRRAVSLWRLLQRHGVIRPSLAELERALSQVRTGNERAKLLKMVSAFVLHHPELAEQVLALLGAFGEGSAMEAYGASPAVSDAVLHAHRSALAAQAAIEKWPELLQLTFTPSLANNRGPEPARLFEVGVYVKCLARRDASQAVAVLIEACVAISDADFSVKQRRKAAAHLRGAAAAVLRSARVAESRALLGTVSRFPKMLAEQTIRAMLSSRERRLLVEQSLATSVLTAGAAAYAARKLAEVPRGFGLGAMPEVIRGVQGP